MIINQPERVMGSGNVIEFTGVIGVAGDTVTLPGRYHEFRIQNLGTDNLYVNIPPFFNYRIRPGVTRHFEKVSVSSLRIRSEAKESQGYWVSATRYGPMRIKLAPPALGDFNYPSIPIDVYTDNEGNYDTDYKVSSLFPAAGVEYFVNAVTGLDTNAGSQAAPFKTINKAASMADAVIVTVKGMVYDRTTAFVNTAVTRTAATPIFIRAADSERVRVVNSSPQAWTPHGPSFPNLYRTTTSGSPISGVYDDSYHDDDDNMVCYKQATSSQACNDTPGSWFASGTSLWVRTFDDRVADDDIKAMKSQFNAQFNNGKFFFQGIDFEGGYGGACIIQKVAAAPTAYFDSCRFKYATKDAPSWGGLAIQGASEVIVQGCAATFNGNDGFNYHAAAGTIPSAVEINTFGGYNGVADDADNGSTTHDGGKIVRLNGHYPKNKGSNVGDNHANTQSWNIGCIADNSTANEIPAFNSNFTAHPDSRVILEGCESRGNSRNDYTIQTGGEIRLRGFSKAPNAKYTVEGTGRVINY